MNAVTETRIWIAEQRHVLERVELADGTVALVVDGVTLAYQGEPTRCAQCGESFTGTYTGSDERGEFVLPNGQHVQAHYECGTHAGWPLA